MKRLPGLTVLRFFAATWVYLFHSPLWRGRNDPFASFCSVGYGDWLNWTPLVLLGEASYSLYPLPIPSASFYRLGSQHLRWLVPLNTAARFLSASLFASPSLSWSISSSRTPAGG